MYARYLCVSELPFVVLAHIEQNRRRGVRRDTLGLIEFVRYGFHRHRRHFGARHASILPWVAHHRGVPAPPCGCPTGTSRPRHRHVTSGMFCASGSCPMPRSGVACAYLDRSYPHNPQLDPQGPAIEQHTDHTLRLSSSCRSTRGDVLNPASVGRAEQIAETVAARMTDPRLPSLPSRSGHSPPLRDLRLCRSRYLLGRR
jgi:hypothetical protein